MKEIVYFKSLKLVQKRDKEKQKRKTKEIVH